MKIVECHGKDNVTPRNYDREEISMDHLFTKNGGCGNGETLYYISFSNLQRFTL